MPKSPLVDLIGEVPAAAAAARCPLTLTSPLLQLRWRYKCFARHSRQWPLSGEAPCRLWQAGLPSQLAALQQIRQICRNPLPVLWIFQNPRVNQTLSCVQAQGVYCCNTPTFIPPSINANTCTSRACKHVVQSLSILLYVQRQTASIHQFCVAIQLWRAAAKRRTMLVSHGMISLAAMA
jgi:hypothetical protein